MNRWQDILKLRKGPPLRTYAEVARMLGVTRQRVRQVCVKRSPALSNRKLVLKAVRCRPVR